MWRNEIDDIAPGVDFYKGVVFCESETVKTFTKSLEQFVLLQIHEERYCIYDAFSHYVFISKWNTVLEPLDEFVLRVIFEGNRPLRFQCNSVIKEKLISSEPILELFYRWNIKVIVYDSSHEQGFLERLQQRTETLANQMQVSMAMLTECRLYANYLNCTLEGDGKMPIELYKSHYKVISTWVPPEVESDSDSDSD